MLYLIGVLGGICLPIQTSVNSRLKVKVGTPFNSSLVSFCIGFTFLLLLLLISGQGIWLPMDKCAGEPWWIWIGGCCGIIFLTGNIVLFGKLGGVETVVLPVMGQIFMGVIVDTFGLFRAVQIPLTLTRIIGMALVVAGVLIVAKAKQPPKTADSKAKAPAAKPSTTIWLWRAMGLCTGMISGSQTAINGYLGRTIESSLKASAVSFGVGVLSLILVCGVLYLKDFRGKKLSEIIDPEKGPWWMWIGGALGATFVLVNILLAQNLGIGLTVIVVLLGTTTGGVLVDQFGIFNSPKRPVNVLKIAGLCVMVAGAAMIKLL